MTKSKRPYQSDQLRTRFRGWELIATQPAPQRATVTGKKGKQSFHINRLLDFEAALREGKAKVNELEGPQQWNESYTNEALR